MSVRYGDQLIWLARRLLSLEGRRGGLPRYERVRLAASIEGEPSVAVLARSVVELFRVLGFEARPWCAAPTDADLPMVAVLPGAGYRYIAARSAQGEWLLEGPQGRERLSDWPQGALCVAVRAEPQNAHALSARVLFRQLFWQERSWIVQAALASLLASVLLLATSLYSLQIYDRVVGAGSVPTLTVLTIGVGIAIVVELIVKQARSAIVEHAVHDLDVRYAHAVFAHVLGIRFDQLPASVGTLAAQVRGYETVRAFATSLALFVVGDAPFALLFLAVIFVLGGVWVAVVPLVAFVIAGLIGLVFVRRIEAATAVVNLVGNRRQGMLVEVVDGLESIKATGSGWRFLGRWNELSERTMQESAHTKRLSDTATFLAGAMQQLSYVGLVATGAYLAAKHSQLTVGGIVACSILSGRVLAPVSLIPGLLVQWGHARIALSHLERLFALQTDNHGVANALVPERLNGHFVLQDVKYTYPGRAQSLAIAQLTIHAGEKVGIVGPVGCGKSTLLRLLAGLCKAQQGLVLLDGLDVQQISRELASERMGYLPQQVSLFGGTLRENLMAGLALVSDEEMGVTIEATGLSGLIAERTEGLDLLIAEGGAGLSGGQRQQVALARVLLARPQLWLLDEPTASMDDVTEARCLATLKERIALEQTLVLVTHKAALLALVERLIVLTPQGVALDGPRDAVLARLRQGPRVQPVPAAVAVPAVQP